jgi:predicted nucleic acid-binding Zn ribbon protein
VQKFTDPPLSVCAVCEGRLRQVFSPVGIVFKGSGFYRTDSRNGSSPAAAAKDKQPAESASSSASESGSGKSSDSSAAKKSGETKSASTGSASSSAREKVA